MISGKGMRPGDIVTAMNGITIEVCQYFLNALFRILLSEVDFACFLSRINVRGKLDPYERLY